jgi:phytoene desaturase
MVRLFEELGGVFRTNAPIVAIETAGNKVTGVRLADGEVLAFDGVASNADVVHTYGTLLAAHPRSRERGGRLAKKRHSMSLFVTYFGVKRHHPQLAHHTVLFGPRYRELIAEIFNGPELPADFSLYLHAPSRSDPSLAPPGHDAFYVLSPVPHLGAADLDWDVVGPAYRDRLLAYLEARCIPGLARDLVTSRMFTPFDFRDELNAHLGSAFSLEPILTQSAWFRCHNRDDVIDNLYVVGAGTHPGAGVPGVIGSAKATASLMLGEAGAR